MEIAGIAITVGLLIEIALGFALVALWFRMRAHDAEKWAVVVGRVEKATSDLRQMTGEQINQGLDRVRDGLDAATDKLTSQLSRESTSSRRELSQAISGQNSELRQQLELLRSATEKKLGQITAVVDRKLEETINQNLGNFSVVSKRLEELQSATGQVVHLSQDIRQLGQILESPKLRGNFGEFQLTQMLRQILAIEAFDEQYRLSPDSEERVDAVIKLKEGLLCIDSKFPLTNARRLAEEKLSQEERHNVEKAFARDVAQHVNDLASKYLIPEVTLDFAFMFIPAEAVYYEILLRPEIHRQALEQHVIPVSPNCLYAYLQAIAIGFRGLKIQAEAKKIERIILGLQQEVRRLEEHFRLIGMHLQRARNQYENAEDDVRRVSGVISNLGLTGEPNTQAALVNESGAKITAAEER